MRGGKHCPVEKRKNILPLKKKERIALIGEFAERPRYQGAGSSIVNPTKLESFLDAVKESELDCIGYAKGYDRYGKRKKRLENAAAELAEKMDTILFFAGLDEVSEAEGIDRRNMKLPSNQLELLERLYALNKKVIVVLSCGSAVEFDAVERADAIVHAYLGGQAGARALLNVLTGKVTPSGKLSESYPYSYEDCPSARYFPGKRRRPNTAKGLLWGIGIMRRQRCPSVIRSATGSVTPLSNIPISK